MIRVNKQVLHKLQREVDNYEQVLLKVTKEAVEQEATFIIDANRFDQLYARGQLANEQKLPPYAPSTIRSKSKRLQKTKNMTLSDTFTFYNSFKLEVGKEDFEITAQAPITETLKRRYGNEVLGLTIRNQNRVSLKVRLQIYAKLRALKFIK